VTEEKKKTELGVGRVGNVFFMYNQPTEKVLVNSASFPQFHPANFKLKFSRI